MGVNEAFTRPGITYATHAISSSVCALRLNLLKQMHRRSKIMTVGVTTKDAALVHFGNLSRPHLAPTGNASDSQLTSEVCDLFI
jgi:hypothetical protein